MYFGKILTADTANGPGMRVTLFVSGCRNACEGCFNKDTWSFHYGKEFTSDIRSKIVDELSKTYYQGLTILGGEPFEPENQSEVLEIIKAVRKEHGNTRDIWVYTGFTYEEIPGSRAYTRYIDGILSGIDVLVDGRFILTEKDIRLMFRGSRNQRVIDVRNTREKGRVILSPYNN